MVCHLWWHVANPYTEWICVDFCVYGPCTKDKGLIYFLKLCCFKKIIYSFFMWWPWSARCQMSQNSDVADISAMPNQKFTSKQWKHGEIFTAFITLVCTGIWFSLACLKDVSSKDISTKLITYHRVHILIATSRY